MDGIDGFVEPSHPVAGRIDRVVDGPPADPVLAHAIGHERPAQTRVGATPRLLVWYKPSVRPHARIWRNTNSPAATASRAATAIGIARAGRDRRQSRNRASEHQSEQKTGEREADS